MNVAKLLTDAIANHLNCNMDGSCGGKAGLCVNVREYNEAITTDLPALRDIRIWMSPTSNQAAYSAAGGVGYPLFFIYNRVIISAYN